MQALLDWVAQNPIATLAIVVYVLVNVLPRPHPDDRTGTWRFIWGVLDRLSVLTAKGLPGSMKMLLKASPKQAAAPKKSE
jgi:hypothetical protein